MSTDHPVRARPGQQGDQIVEVIADHGYEPQSIVATAGIPLRLVFRRRDDDACMDRIVFSSPHLDRRLARGRATTIVLPAQPPGEIRFTCGMGRYHGEIELRTEAASPINALRRAISAGLQRARRHVPGPAQPTVERAGVATVPAPSSEVRSPDRRSITGADARA